VKLLSVVGWVMGFMLALPAEAELQIEVTQGADDAVNIAVVREYCGGALWLARSRRAARRVTSSDCFRFTVERSVSGASG